jgi:O-Antigen ligase
LDAKSRQARSAASLDDTDREQEAAEMAERVRKIALGLTAALITARAFWPSEPDLKEGAGGGLYWLFVVYIAFGLALTSALVGGRVRFRWSWTDAAVVGLMALVAASAFHALDRRPAINLAWEWAGLGMIYLLVRNLPRTQDESSALAGVLVATAFAVSVYGVYQLTIELPLIRAEYMRNPQAMLQRLGIEPNTTGEVLFRNRLLSTEIWSTFALANSLAGYLVGPLVVALAVAFRALGRRDKPESPWVALLMAAPVILILLIVVTLTKSRSAWIGLLGALVVLAWHARRHVSARRIVAAGLILVGILSGVAVVGFRIGLLDREILTQAKMSMGYRWEYWQGAWGVITGGATGVWQAVSSPFFWWGVGPGNFGGPYLRYKLPQASEEILDPHNLFLDVWATAGFWAFAALAAALALGLWNVLARGVPIEQVPDAGRASRAARRKMRRAGASSVGSPERRSDDPGPDAPPRQVNWLVASAGIGGWALVVLLGRLNPFEGDLFYRWLILGASWVAAVFLGMPVWRRLPVPGIALGAGVVAILINLLAAGGIGVPTVALALWCMLAIGLNLREDRPCGWLREYESRVPPFAVAVGWAALLGTFVGLVAPFWRSESFIAEAQAALSHRPPDFDRADAAYVNAMDADRYFARPWREDAALHLMVWQQQGASSEKTTTRWYWKTIPLLYEQAAMPPRNPNDWGMHSERARVIHRILNLIGSKLEPPEAIRQRGELVKSTRTATRLNPTSAALHARLAHASADIQMYQDAVNEANEALRLDELTPHLDKKLQPREVAETLKALIPTWQKNAAKMPIQPAP